MTFVHDGFDWYIKLHTEEEINIYMINIKIWSDILNEYLRAKENDELYTARLISPFVYKVIDYAKGHDIEFLDALVKIRQDYINKMIDVLKDNDVVYVSKHSPLIAKINIKENRTEERNILVFPEDL